ncbi:LOW QUALITY PROTEIN: hypothetical protein PHMEG_00024827 [Phytophthora megakarya]|uniref:Uncharacterized protein n=1 Tax=Phytophthora megakarya TaxID=4795 RepID=A0A225VE92_9STRA|nr:LOW QUALITY PROTEIN: hypothetical protein PHMEG_00024827 [Phytophthora megakarya]
MEADEAMVLHSDNTDSVYLPLPLYSDVDLWLQQTTTRTARIQSSDTKGQVEALVQTVAAAHHETTAKLGEVQRQQDHMAVKTTEFLQT